MNKKTLKDVDISGKRVLVRADFNVPFDVETGAIADDSRIRATLPTISYLLGHRAKIILCSHLGRPEGKVVKDLSLAPVAGRLSELLGVKVSLAEDCIGPAVQDMAMHMKEGDVLLLENLRFHPEEEKNDPNFAKQLSRLAEVFVNDAFGTTHRAHASTVGVASYLPSVAGLLVEKEIEAMGKVLENPRRPFAAVVGGAKVSDKITLLSNIIDKVDSLLVGGGMACTFLKAEGFEVGASLLEKDKVETARSLLQKAKGRGVHFLLPLDAVVAVSLNQRAESKIVPVDKVPPGWTVADIGPRTSELFAAELKECRTVVWNGPLGVFEVPQFSQGTRAMAQTLASLRDATTVIGGGSTAEAVAEMGLEGKMSHVSTGGGAFLEFLEGRTLPGIAALQDKER